MRLLNGLRLAQRIVLVIALAFILGALGIYLTSLGTSGAYFGWFGYAPLPPGINIVSGPDLAPWAQLLVWIGLILMWAATSIFILKAPRRASGSNGATITE